MVTLLRHASLLRLQAHDQMIFTVDQLVNHFRTGLGSETPLQVGYGLNCRLSFFLLSLKNIKYSARLRRWSNEYV